MANFYGPTTPTPQKSDDALDENSTNPVQNKAVATGFFALHKKLATYHQEYDYNQDGVVDENDVLYLLYHSAFPSRYPLPEGTISDLNGDGKVTAEDGILLREKILGGEFIEAKFPTLFSNAIRNNATGEVVAMADVSPIVHEMSVNLSSDSITDFSTVKVTKQGLNLFDQESFFNQYGFVKQEDGSWLGKSVFKRVFTPPIQKQGSMYIQLKARNASTTIPFYLTVYYTDGTTATACQMAVNITEMTTFSYSTNPNKTVNYIQWNHSGSGDYYIKDVIFSYGACDYEPYIGETETYTPTADGTVKGIIANGDPMTLITDTSGVVISAEYNADTKKYIDKKFAELQALVLEV